MKLPDFFYIKQTRALNNLHDFSVELLARLYAQANPVDAYSSEWGDRQIRNLTVSIETALDVLKSDTIHRLLRQRLSPPGFTHRAELDRDVLKMEILQGNIEHELSRIYLKKSALLGWIQAAILLAILACQLLRLKG